jgi:hypothetical protein
MIIDTLELLQEEPGWEELQSNISVPRSAKLAGISVEAFRKHFAQYIRRIGERRDVVNFGVALKIARGEIK